jgi:hypothetical protein
MRTDKIEILKYINRWNQSQITSVCLIDIAKKLLYRHI